MKNKEIVRNVIQSFLRADIEKALSFMTEDVKLSWPGYFDLEAGKDAIREFYKDVPELVASELGDLIEEGDTVIGNGKMTALHENGTVKNSFFCDIYKLENGLVREIKSHVIFEGQKN
ncbi:MAG TPA: nuclear transport factor 2 family protein [Chryseosolibacter sp.]